jgi:hypothetical protein
VQAALSTTVIMNSLRTAYVNIAATLSSSVQFTNAVSRTVSATVNGTVGMVRLVIHTVALSVSVPAKWGWKSHIVG